MIYIQFVYILKKSSKENFILIYKDNDSIDINLYKMSYETIYHKTYDESINIYDCIYIKKGIKIKYNSIVWNDLIKFNMKTLNLMDMIDEIHLLGIYNSNHLLFNYNNNSDKINDIIIESFFNNYIYNTGI